MVFIRLCLCIYNLADSVSIPSRTLYNLVVLLLQFCNNFFLFSCLRFIFFLLYAGFRQRKYHWFRRCVSYEMKAYNDGLGSGKRCGDRQGKANKGTQLLGARGSCPQTHLLPPSLCHTYSTRYASMVRLSILALSKRDRTSINADFIRFTDIKNGNQRELSVIDFVRFRSEPKNNIFGSRGASAPVPHCWRCQCGWLPAWKWVGVKFYDVGEIALNVFPIHSLMHTASAAFGSMCIQASKPIALEIKYRMCSVKHECFVIAKFDNIILGKNTQC